MPNVHTNCWKKSHIKNIEVTTGFLRLGELYFSVSDHRIFLKVKVLYLSE